nr:unnamed protein product [Callosobruchus analis]
MTIHRSPTTKRLLDKWPGKKYLGIYRFLPIFFVLGAVLEFSMINWQVGETNFYKTFKRRQAKNLIEKQLYESQIE